MYEGRKIAGFFFRSIFILQPLLHVGGEENCSYFFKSIFALKPLCHVGREENCSFFFYIFLSYYHYPMQEERIALLFLIHLCPAAINPCRRGGELLFYF